MAHPIQFPTEPAVGQEYLAENTVTYIWTGDRWSAARAITTKKYFFTQNGSFSDWEYNPSTDELLDGGWSGGSNP